MKNKIIKCSMFLSFIFLAGLVTYGILKYFNENKFSEEVVLNTDYQANHSSCKKFTVTKTDWDANISGIHSGNYYSITMDGQNALCLDPGKAANSSFKYGTSEEGSDDRVGKALNVINNNRAVPENIAQIYAWGALKGLSDAEIINKIFSARIATTLESATSYITTINMSIPIPYCIYESSSGAQRIAYPKSGSCEIECTIKRRGCKNFKIVKTNSNAVCDDNVKDAYEFYESSGYVGSNGEDNVNEYGRKEENAYGNDYCNVYCLENAKVVLPRTPTVEIGQDVLVWPTSKTQLINGLNNYPLKFKSTKKCHVFVEKTGYCTKKSVIDEYFDYRKAYIDNKDKEYSYCKSAPVNYTSTCSTTITDKIIEDIRTSSDCFGGNHNENIELCVNNFKTNSTALRNAQYNADGASQALDSCKRSHSGQKYCSEYKTDGKTCKTYLPKDDAYLEANDCALEKGYYNYWTGEVGKINAVVEALNTLATNYWGAEKILDSLNKCELKSRDQEFSGTFISGAKVEDVNGTSINLVANSDSVTYECNNCFRSHYFIDKTKEIISSSDDLITKRSLESKVDNMVRVEFEMSADDISYKLPDASGYKYISSSGNLTNSVTEKYKETTEYPNMSLGDNINNSIKILKTDPKVKLIIAPFGSNGQFKFEGTEYVCRMIVKEKDGCECPPETNSYGLDLTRYMSKEGLTCAEATAKYCNKDNQDRYYCPSPNDNIEITSCINSRSGSLKSRYDKCVEENCGPYACPDGSEKSKMTMCIGDDYIGNYMSCYERYCLCANCYCGDGTDYPTKVITGCVNSNTKKYGTEEKAAQYCRNKLCYKPNNGKGFKYVCKEGARIGMDVTPCVELYLKNKGIDLSGDLSSSSTIIENARKYCEDVLCPYGLKIIYRTIKLENPFPSYDADNTKINGLDIGTYNLNVSGRYPGSNWDSKLLVYNKIINNRGTQFSISSQISNASSFVGTSIYQNRTPLYTFKLTPAIINNIRNYNKENSYDDFTLKCKSNGNDKNKACLSEFIHGRITDVGYVGLQASSSTCFGAGNVGNDFYSCVNTANP